MWEMKKKKKKIKENAKVWSAGIRKIRVLLADPVEETQV